MRATSVPSDQSSQAQADPLLSGNHKSRGPSRHTRMRASPRALDSGTATEDAQRRLILSQNASISLRMEASQVLYRRETGFVAQTSDLCLRHKSQLSKDPAGSTPLVSCRLTDEHDRLSTRRSSGNGPEVYCGSRGLASASQRGPFFHSTESQSHNGLSFGICGLTPKFSAAAVPFFSIR